MPNRLYKNETRTQAGFNIMSLAYKKRKLGDADCFKPWIM
ncbi:hypothetical protein MicvaDRAFT_1220 [Microcoleus vaginatus FGP-2]|nr:hypothetical protein MicvaDRAFT_1220 [Microcoleus vaginatus FGP-2]